jgi:hypothetical protein
MRHSWLIALTLMAVPVVAFAQSQFVNSDGSRTSGSVLECLSGSVVVPCGSLSVPLEMDQGTAGTAIAPPSGGQGVLGFLSGLYVVMQAIYTKLVGTLSVSGSVTSMPISAALIDNSAAALGLSSTVLLQPCGTGTAQQTGCGSVVGRSRLLLLNEGTANVCVNYGGAAAFASGSSSNCLAGSILLSANGGGVDDSTGVVTSQQVSAICASGTCSLTVKSF